MYRVLSVGGAVWLLDRLGKWWIAETFSLHESRPLIPGIFHLTRVENSGAAFGLFPGQTALLSLISFGVVLAILWYSREIHDRISRLGFGLVLGGAAGNFVDRVWKGSVTDFLDFRIWPVFNVADAAVVCGVFLLAFVMLRGQEAPSR